jgi:nucleoid-associated protein YgaU
MRQPGFTASGFLIIAVLLLVGLAGTAPAAAWQNASPAAGTPAVIEVQSTQAPAQPTTVPAGTPVPPAQTDVVTLVLWYQNAADQDIIELYPLATDAGFVARPQQGAAAVGTVDFPTEGVPTVVVGNTTFETYPRPDGVIERWTWMDDFEGARPGTLVMQLAGLDGTYQNYFGTGTFVSRDDGGAGGVLTLALRPPSPAAANEATAEPAAADAAAAEPAADEAVAAADQPDATVEPGTEILTEPATEDEAPVTEGEAPAEPGA